MTTSRPVTLVEIGATGHSARSREERLAFWIHAYNALVVRGIEKLELRQSVWEVSDFFEQIAVRVEGLVSPSLGRSVRECCHCTPVLTS